MRPLGMPPWLKPKLLEAPARCSRADTKLAEKASLDDDASKLYHGDPAEPAGAIPGGTEEPHPCTCFPSLEISLEKVWRKNPNFCFGEGDEETRRSPN